MIAHATAVGESGGDGSPLRFILLVAGLALLAVGARIHAARKEGSPKWLPFVVGGLGVALGLSGLVSVNSGKSSEKIYLTLLEPDSGVAVAANQDVPVKVNVEGAELAASPTAKTGGHLHLYVDDRLQSMPYGSDAVVQLPPGRHTLRVEFVDEKHAPYKPPIQVESVVIAG